MSEVLTNTVLTRILHKRDTYANWMASSLVLKHGEIAICEIPSSASDSGLTPPAIGIKVGDGTSTFSQLAWIQSKAGDVYAWAKKEHLDYNDLSDDFKAAIKENSDTNTTYKFEFKNNALVLYKHELGANEEEWDQVGDPITLDLTTKVDKVSGVVDNVVLFAADGAIKDGGVAISSLETKANAAAIYATKTDVEDLSDELTDATERIGVNETDIAALKTADQTLQSNIDTKISKVTSAVAGDVATFVAGGEVQDSGVLLSDLAVKTQVAADIEAATTTINNSITGVSNRVTDNATAIEEIQETLEVLTGDNVISLSTKADKVTGAVAGNVASLNAEGNLVDGGVAVSALAKSADVASTYATITTVNGLSNALTAATERIGVNETAIGALQTTTQSLNDNKVDKVAGVADNIVVFDANKAIKDSGVAYSSLAVKTEVANTYATKEALDTVEETLATSISGVKDIATETKNAVAILNGDNTVEGSVKYQIDTGLNEFAQKITDDGTVNSFKELVDWVAVHGPEAAEMASAIQTNAADIKTNAENIAANTTAITNVKVTADTAVQQITGVTATKTGTTVEVTAVSTDLLVNGTKVLVFDCGTASTVIE